MNKFIGKVVRFFIKTFSGTGLEQELNTGAEGTLTVPEIIPICRKVAADSAVLLKNDGVLPIGDSRTVALFGRASFDYFTVGYGSGGDVVAPYKVNLAEGLKNAGVKLEETLLKKYDDWRADPKNKPDEGFWGHWPMSFPEMPLSDEDIAVAASNADVAVVTVGRAAGEDRENVLEPGSFYLTEDERKNTAYHESGHALVAKLLPKSDPVHKVTIIPRGRALGVTMQLPEEDRYSYDRDYLLTRIAILFGGRIAEEVFMNQMTTGASNDFERASQLARDMVMRYGMSDKMGVMVYAENEGEVFLGRSVTKTTHISEKTMQAVDAEIRRILDEQYKRARQVIEEHQEEMHRMAKALLDWETIDSDQIDDILAGKEPRAPKAPVTGSAKPAPVKDEKPAEEMKPAPEDDPFGPEGGTEQGDDRNRDDAK